MEKYKDPRSIALTTTDNPFSPFEDFDKWYAFDTSRGYNSSEYLSRIAKTSEAMGPNQLYDELERAIDEIVKLNVNGKYKKVFKK